MPAPPIQHFGNVRHLLGALRQAQDQVEILRAVKFRALDVYKRQVRTPYTRAGLAAYLGCDRSALCRELSRMRRDGILQIDGRVFRLLPGVPPRQNGRPVRADREENDGM